VARPVDRASSPDAPAFREVMFVDRDWRGIEGRWFTGGYDEIGMDVQLRRAGGDLTILGVRPAPVCGWAATGHTVKLFGAQRARPVCRPPTSISGPASPSPRCR
jgi:hypothetical protein